MSMSIVSLRMNAFSGSDEATIGMGVEVAETIVQLLTENPAESYVAVMLCGPIVEPTGNL